MFADLFLLSIQTPAPPSPLRYTDSQRLRYSLQMLKLPRGRGSMRISVENQNHLTQGKTFQIHPIMLKFYNLVQEEKKNLSSPTLLNLNHLKEVHLISISKDVPIGAEVPQATKWILCFVWREPTTSPVTWGLVCCNSWRQSVNQCPCRQNLLI